MGTIRFNLRTDKVDKSFKSPVELVYQISGQRKYYALKEIKLNAIYWDKDEQSAIFINPAKAKKQLFEQGVKQGEDVVLLNSEIESINDQIAALRANVRNIERRFGLDDMEYSAAMVIDALKDGSVAKTKKEEHKEYVFDFVDKYISDHAESRELGSLGVYRSLKSHLQNFQTQTTQKVRFDTIDYAFFQSFQNFLIKQASWTIQLLPKRLVH